MEKVMFIVQRVSDDSKTVAIVTAGIENPALSDEGNFFSALMAAITEWVKTTADGKKAWKRSSQDFNIGDLDLEQPFSHLLSTILAKHGIWKMHIKAFDQTERGYWQYDDKLVDENEF